MPAIQVTAALVGAALAAGAAVPVDKYQYSVRFYAPLRGMVAPYLRDLVDSFYMSLAAWGAISSINRGKCECSSGAPPVMSMV